ncbi:hypothetical protein [Escherichia coli]|uniref:hypothetical protein n=1 Tax=Escherichia coli TaxID=562 RepID=UPI0013B01EEE|nr:hypothetical protein [Escherichia coli]
MHVTVKNPLDGVKAKSATIATEPNCCAVISFGVPDTKDPLPVINTEYFAYIPCAADKDVHTTSTSYTNILWKDIPGLTGGIPRSMAFDIVVDDDCLITCPYA